MVQIDAIPAVLFTNHGPSVAPPNQEMEIPILGSIGENIRYDTIRSDPIEYDRWHDSTR